MAMWLQNLVVLAIVLICAGVVLWKTVAAWRSGEGKCCAHGCGGNDRASKAKRVHFLPVESLGRRRRR